MRGLLDTSVVIAAGDEAGFVERLPEEAAISVVTLAELHYGVLVARDAVTRERRLVRAGRIEATFDPLPIDADVARSFATVAAAVRRQGRQPRARIMDLWIAATALTHEMPLFTRNPDDLRGLDDLIHIEKV